MAENQSTQNPRRAAKEKQRQEGEEQPKTGQMGDVSWLEIICLLALAAIKDLTDIILNFLVIGAVVNPITQVPVALTIGTWCFFRLGNKITWKRYYCAAVAGKPFPFLSAIPAWTAFAAYLVGAKLILSGGRLGQMAQKIGDKSQM